MKSSRAYPYFLFVLAVIFFAAGTSRAVAQQELSARVSLEFEYLDKVMDESIKNGDIQGLAEAHIIMTNLARNLEQLKEPDEKIRFTIAVGYEYVQMCPAVYFLQLYQESNPSGFTIDCVQKSMESMQNALRMADKSLKEMDAADAYFFAGIGMDRLKFNMSNIPGAETERFYDQAKQYLEKANSLGTSFDGIATILARLDKVEYLKSPVVDDTRYGELRRMLMFGAVVPVVTPVVPEVVQDKAPEPATPQKVDENTYIDYKWRFSVRRPDDSWVFSTRTAGQSLHLVIRRKNPLEQKGSGLNVICTPLKVEDTGKPLEKIVEKSIELLKSAGYSSVEGSNTTFAGLPAYEIKSVHSYNDLIPTNEKLGEGDVGAGSSDNMASRQYMVIIVSNGIQYIVSFSSLDTEYPRVFPVYHSISQSMDIF